MAYPPLFSTSLPRRLALQASNPLTYALCVILIERVSPQIKGVGSGSVNCAWDTLTACAKDRGFGGATTTKDEREVCTVDEGNTDTACSVCQSKFVARLADCNANYTEQYINYSNPKSRRTTITIEGQKQFGEHKPNNRRFKIQFLHSSQKKRNNQLYHRT